jgi:diphosphomevalonate decarboxylase
MEEEALSLHAMMMTSRPGYLLMQPATLSIIQRVRAFRNETGSRVGFTLDAGANVHLLYAKDDAEAVGRFIRSDLTPYCEDGKLIADRMGNGPEILRT